MIPVTTNSTVGNVSAFLISVSEASISAKIQIDAVTYLSISLIQLSSNTGHFSKENRPLGKHQKLYGDLHADGTTTKVACVDLQCELCFPVPLRRTYCFADGSVVTIVVIMLRVFPRPISSASIPPNTYVGTELLTPVIM